MLEDAAGVVVLQGLTRVAVENAEELLAAVGRAQELRAVAATGVHDASSRSHAICRVFVGDTPPPPGAEAAASPPQGVLTLVDLAGSEWAADRAQHDKALMKEAAQINLSLMTLKDCVRARTHNERLGALSAGAAGPTPRRVPYRDAKLTRILQDSFSGSESP